MEDKKEISIPFLMDYMSATNRRMFHALLAVCLTFILTIIIFVVGYTSREHNWQDTVKEITKPGVTDGVHQFTDP